MKADLFPGCHCRPVPHIRSLEEVSWLASSLICFSCACLQGGPDVGQPARSPFRPNRLSSYWWLQMPRGFDQDFCAGPCVTTNTTTVLLCISMWARHKLLWVLFSFRKSFSLVMTCTKRDGSFSSASRPPFSAEKQVCAAGVNADVFHIVWAPLQPTDHAAPTCFPSIRKPIWGFGCQRLIECKSRSWRGKS